MSSMKFPPDKKCHIEILNWDKYQRPLRGEANRRSWIAMSVDLYSDQDFLDMKSVERESWVVLLLHAGKVGAMMKLSANNVRAMGQLHHSPDLNTLVNQGFIRCRSATDRQTDKTDNIRPKKGGKPTKAVSRFEEFYHNYPRKEGRKNADKAWQKNSAMLDSMADKLIADCKNRVLNHNSWQEKQYIPLPSTYLNQARWEDEIMPIAKQAKRISFPPENDSEAWSKLAKEYGVNLRGMNFNQARAAILESKK